MKQNDNLRHMLGVATAMMIGASAHATPVTISDTFHFLDNRSANSVGIFAGVRQQFGAISATPTAGTTGSASQNNLTVPLLFQPFTVSPNFYSTSIPAAPQFAGQWQLSFTNGPDVANALTPSVTGAAIMPHPTSTAISGSGSNSSFSWTNPTGTNIDSVRLQIWDRQVTVGNTVISDIIYSNSFAPSLNSFALSSSGLSLLTGHKYSFEISLLDLRNPNGSGGNPNILSRSRSFFDFQLLGAGAPTQVFLPTVSLNGSQPTFSFSTNVVGGQQIFIDPDLAVGYDYQIGAGDPLMRSVLLPANIGDGLYDIYLWDGSGWVLFSANVQGGTDFDFGPNGVDQFRVLGIETSAGLDPTDPTAFITGLTFVGSGQFTGTMTPIIVSVPEPGTLLLVGIAFATVFLSRRGRFGNRSGIIQLGA